MDPSEAEVEVDERLGENGQIYHEANNEKPLQISVPRPLT